MKKNKDLRDFLDVVKKGGPEYYIEVNKPLDPHLEVGVITHKLYKTDRTPVVFCPEMKGSKLPLVTNMLSSYELLGVAMGMEPGKVVKSEILHEYVQEGGDCRAQESQYQERAPSPQIAPSAEEIAGKEQGYVVRYDYDAYVRVGYAQTFCDQRDIDRYPP